MFCVGELKLNEYHNSFCVGVCYLLAILLSSMTSHCISGVMVSMLASIAVDRGYEPQSCQAKIELVFVASPMPLVVSLNPVHGRVYTIFQLYRGSQFYWW
jgi:hypothetical protein